MNEEHFVAKYSPLGIDLQVIAYQSALQAATSTETDNTYNNLDYISDITADESESTLADSFRMAAIHPITTVTSVGGLKI